MGSFSDRYKRERTGDSGGGGGFHLPKLGLRELVSMPGQALIGVGRLGASLAPGGVAAGEAFSEAGKGIGSSLMGTLATAGSVIGVPGHNLGNYIERVGTEAFGEDHPVEDFFSRSRKRGILPSLVEDVGNVALAGEGASLLLKGTEVGRAANLAATASRAERAGFAASDIERAIEAGRVGTKLKDVGIHDSMLRDVGKAASKAGNTSLLDQGAVSRTAEMLNRAHTVAHPYQSLAHDVLRPLTRAAQARVLGPLEAAPEAAQAATEAAPSLLDELAAIGGRGPSDATERLYEGFSPMEQAAQEAAAHVEGADFQGRQAAATEARRAAALSEFPDEPVVKLYRGQGEGLAGEFWTPDIAEAQAHATAAGGHVLETDVPQSVADAARANAAALAHNGTHASTHMLDPYWADLAKPAEAAAPIAEAAPVVEHVPSATGTSQAYPGYEAAARRSAEAPIPDWATTLVDRLPAPVNRVLDRGERIAEGRQANRVGVERGRMQDIARREQLRSGPVRATKDAAKLLVDKKLPDGTVITRQIADELIGDELKARLTQVADVERRAGESGIDPTAVRAALVEAGQRAATSIPTEWLTDAAGNATALSKAIDSAAAGWATALPERLDILSETRKGTEGLENVGSRTPEMSKSEKALARSIEKDRARVERLGPKADRERATIQRRIGRTEARLEALRAEQRAAVESGAEASQRFTQTRLPGGRAVEDVMGGAYRADTATGLSAGDMEALGLQGGPDATLAAKSPGQQALSTPDVAGLTQHGMYRRGVEGGQAMGDIRAAADRAVDTQRRVKQLERNLADLKKTLVEHRSPTEIVRERLTSRANQRADRLAGRLANPATSRVPSHFQPVYKAVKAIAKAAETDARLAGAVGDITDKWGEVLRIADEKGFDPTHISNLTDSEVRRLVYEQVQLGKRGRDLSQSIKAGARYARRGADDRRASWDVLAASMVQATHEANTNALVDYVEDVAAKPVRDLGNGKVEIPDGWVPWDAERNYLLHGQEKVEGGMRLTGEPAPTKMIPKEVKVALRSLQQDFSHPVFRGIRAATDPWRLLVLTLSPRWYVNNVFGNVLLATKEGVRIEDWRSAWDSYRKGGVDKGANRLMQRIGQGTRAFEDVPGAVEGGVFQEAATGAETLLEPKRGVQGVRQSIREAPNVRGKVEAATRPLRRANEAVDELARVAAYHSGIRRGLSTEEALQRTYKALVDYNDLSPMEREVVRSVVPFYSWQKGILKTVSRVAADNTAATGIIMALGDLNKELAQDRYGGELPDYYTGMVTIPGLGTVNTRAWNPFADAGSLVTPQGIASSLNPYVEVFTRNALGAPDFMPHDEVGGFRPEQTRINEFGSEVPDTSPFADLTNTLLSLPQVRAFEGGSGGFDSAVGARRYSDEDIKKLRDRLAKAREFQSAR